MKLLPVFGLLESRYRIRWPREAANNASVNQIRRYLILRGITIRDVTHHLIRKLNIKMKSAFSKKWFGIAIFLSIIFLDVAGQENNEINRILQQKYNLVPEHSPDTQYYAMESKLQKFALDGTRLGTVIYRLYLRCVPDPKSGLGADEYTCLRFTVKVNDSPEISIPALKNWKYLYRKTENAKDEKGQVFGIDHSKFERITDERGRSLPVENTYHVYNAFIDFHAMGVFAEKTPSGNGVQDLHRIGQKIIHMASHSQPPVNLGTQVGEGSYFRNGEVTLEFKGLSIINGKTCALLEYDSGESSFFMITKPFPNVDVKTKGSSHYLGDIYKDLQGGWIQKAILHELVISETVIPGQSNKIYSVIERSISINNVARIGN